MARRRGVAWRHFVTLQHENATRDDDGQPIPDWETFRNYRDVPARIHPVTAGEKVNGRIIEATTTFVVEVMPLEAITPKMRIKTGSRTLEITKVFEAELPNQSLELHCVEVVA